MTTHLLDKRCLMEDCSLRGPSGLPPAVWDLVAEAVEASHAPGTRAVYASHWRDWKGWCACNDVPDLPTNPEHLATYLAERATRHVISTVRTAAAAIGVYHTRAGHQNPAQDRGVVMVLGGLARKYGSSPQQVEGLTVLNLASISAVARMPRDRESVEAAHVRGITDLAMIGLMRDVLLRRSEAAALTWKDLTEEFDGSGRLTIARSKTDQEGQGAVGYVSSQTMRWVKEMRENSSERGTIIGLCAHQIARRIVSAAAAAGLQGRYGGHSPRIGMAMDLALADVQLPGLMQVGRWKKPDMPAYYIRNIKAAQGAVATWYAMRGA